ncbi:hypothetical protein F5887DRAFT_921148 [Amanita rubescens]|nr:hypothetical protein F5887DRAFT_921148 [Amanita rubescens]
MVRLRSRRVPGTVDRGFPRWGNYPQRRNPLGPAAYDAFIFELTQMTLGIGIVVKPVTPHDRVQNVFHDIFSGFCSAAYMLGNDIGSGQGHSPLNVDSQDSRFLCTSVISYLLLSNNMKFSATVLMAIVCASVPAFAVPGYYPQVVTLGEEYCLPGCWPAPPLPNVCPLKLILGECSKCCT